MNLSKLKWDQRFLAFAKHAAEWSKDPNTKVGAIIVDDHRKIIGVGYNGFARGAEDQSGRLNNRELKNDLTVHAELNAVLNAIKSTEGCTIYTTHPPCVKCASVIIQAGIKRVVSAPISVEFMKRWEESMNLSKVILSEAGVQQEYEIGE